MPSAVEDCRSAVEDRHGSRRRKAKGQRQEIAAEAEDRRVGRPARSTDVHSMHRILGGRPTGRPKALSAGTQLSVVLGRPTGRPVEEVGRPTGRPIVWSG